MTNSVSSSFFSFTVRLVLVEGMERAVATLGQRCDFEGVIPSALETSPCVSAAKCLLFLTSLLLSATEGPLGWFCHFPLS